MRTPSVASVPGTDLDVKTGTGPHVKPHSPLSRNRGTSPGGVLRNKTQYVRKMIQDPRSARSADDSDPNTMHVFRSFEIRLMYVRWGVGLNTHAGADGHFISAF